MLDKILLTKKIEMLIGYIEEMKPFIDMPLSEIIGSLGQIRAMERIFQLIVDKMIEINIYLIKEGELGLPDDLQNTFKILGEHNVLDSNFAFKIAPIVGLRNMIVHKYEKVDKDVFIKHVKTNYSDFKEYLIQIDKFIKKNNVIPPK